MFSFCNGKHIIAAFTIASTILIYSAETFEQLKTNFLIYIGLGALLLLLLDSIYGDDLRRSREGFENIIEGFSTEGLENLASMFKDGKLIVTDLQVTGKADIKNIDSDLSVGKSLTCGGSIRGNSDLIINKSFTCNGLIKGNGDITIARNINARQISTDEIRSKYAKIDNLDAKIRPF